MRLCATIPPTQRRKAPIKPQHAKDNPVAQKHSILAQENRPSRRTSAPTAHARNSRNQARAPTRTLLPLRQVPPKSYRPKSSAAPPRNAPKAPRRKPQEVTQSNTQPYAPLRCHPQRKGANTPRTTPLLKHIRFLRKKLAQAAEPTPPREIPETKRSPPREPYYPDGKVPRHRTAIRMMPPIEKMPPKPPGANRKK